MVPLLILFFVLLFYGDYFLVERGYSIHGRLLAEAFSGLLLLIVVAQVAMHRRFNLPPKYAFWFFSFTSVIIAGLLANQVPTGALVMGIRENFKFAPMFLLPIVYHFKPEQMKALLLALLFFASIQLPFMVNQRMTELWLTGDYITGTLISSNFVSMFLICCWAVVFGFFLRKKIGLPFFLLLSIVLIFPTMLNETKGSLVLLPFAFVLPMAFAPGITRLGLKMTFSGIAFVMLALVYSVMDRILLGERPNYAFLDLFLNPDQLMAYLTPSAQGGSWMGRGDKLLLAWSNATESVTSFFLGVGLGNVNDTSHTIFEGDYTEFGKLLDTTFNQYLWETGMVGALLALMLPVMSFFDAKNVARLDSDLPGVIANGWVAVAIIIFLGAFYIRGPDAQALTYLFFFFSGYMAANAYQLRFSTATNALHKREQLGTTTPSLLAQRSRIAS